MSRKIFTGIFAVALTVWLACIVCIVGALYYYFNDKSAEEFRNEAIFIAQGIEASGEPVFGGAFRFFAQAQ